MLQGRKLIVMGARVLLVAALIFIAFDAWDRVRDAGSNQSCSHYVQQNSGTQQQELDRSLAQNPNGAPSAQISIGDFLGDGHSLLCALRSGSTASVPSEPNPVPALPH